jgi:hypothetical protein
MDARINSAKTNQNQMSAIQDSVSLILFDHEVFFFIMHLSCILNIYSKDADHRINYRLSFHLNIKI